MDEAQFWQLIEQSKNKRGDCEAQAEKLQTLLLELEAEEIVAFDRFFRESEERAYRYDLWGVAYIVNGGASDDGFQYFRWWLVAQGREYFEAAMENPERAADAADPGGDNACEAVAYAINQAYERKTGREMPEVAHHSAPQPQGKAWEEDDLEALFPTLWAKFAD